MSAGADDRDTYYADLYQRLMTAARAPSSMKAEELRSILTEAADGLQACLIDLRGWESEQ